jgi:peptidylamidoglycolate lyase
MNRREFCAITGAAALGSFLGPDAYAHTKMEERSLDSPQLQTGNGEWTYRVVSNWGQLPAGKTFGGTHGGIATDKAGLL